jgi:hypothetical protein
LGRGPNSQHNRDVATNEQVARGDLRYRSATFQVGTANTDSPAGRSPVIASCGVARVKVSVDHSGFNHSARWAAQRRFQLKWRALREPDAKSAFGRGAVKDEHPPAHRLKKRGLSTTKARQPRSDLLWNDDRAPLMPLPNNRSDEASRNPRR